MSVEEIIEIKGGWLFASIGEWMVKGIHYDLFHKYSSKESLEA